MEQATNAYYTITASSEFREAERLREKARHDEAQALYHAKTARSMEIARNLIKMGMSANQIAEATGLSQEDINRLM